MPPRQGVLEQRFSDRAATDVAGAEHQNGVEHENLMRD